jgi:hypothetical protein
MAAAAPDYRVGAPTERLQYGSSENKGVDDELGISAQDLIDRAYDTGEARLNLRPFLRYAGNADIPSETEEEKLRHLKELILLGYRPTYLEEQPARGNTVAILAKEMEDRRWEGEMWGMPAPLEYPIMTMADQNEQYLKSWNTPHELPYAQPIHPYLQNVSYEGRGLSDYYQQPLVPEMRDQIWTAEALNADPQAFQGENAFV